MRTITETSYKVNSQRVYLMNRQYFKLFLALNFLFQLGINTISIVHAQEAAQDNYYLEITSENIYEIQLVQNSNQQPSQNPPSGNLLFPSANDPNNREGKKCMTVCARWGEECTFTDRGAGGTTRDCRRTCQQFTEECF